MTVEGGLVLADGTEFEGVAVGANGIAQGEVVFNTAMTGYQEIATDPSYAGQIVAMTAPHIGNYGWSPDDDQADRAWCSGFVTRAMTDTPSSWRAEGGFASWLAERGVIALGDVDTRRLTRHVRSHGSMPGAIGAGVDSSALREAARSAPTMEGRDLTTTVTTDEPYVVKPTGRHTGRVVALDFGIKRDIVQRLAARGHEVTVLPAGADAAEILALDPVGVFLSNGPGDPEPVRRGIATVEALLGQVPVFGICLGHQILGLALGARTYKLPFGHHGGNHPVRDLATGRVAVTAQNHGFAVDLWPLAGTEPPPREGLAAPRWLPASVDTDFGVVEPSHQNLNDGTLEGLRCRDVPAFSVQYHPEAAPGPSDADELFDRFTDLTGRP